MTSHPSGEILGLDQSIAYAEQVAQLAGEHAPAGNEGYLAHLARSHVDGAGLVTARQMQDAFAAARAAATQHATELARQKSVQQQYDANPDAGDKHYQQAGAGAAPRSVPSTKERRMPRTNKHMSFCNGRHAKYQEECQDKIGAAPVDPEYGPIDVTVEASPGGEARICVGDVVLASAEAVDDLIALLNRAKARHTEVEAELGDQCFECQYPVGNPAHHCPQCLACHPANPCEDCAADAADAAA